MNRRTLARRVHPVAGIVALLTIAAFWVSTVIVELVGSPGAVVAVKQTIPWGLVLLVPAIAAAGGTGFALGGRSPDRLVSAKKRRMRVIGALGLVVLVPCVLYLGFTADADRLDGTFYAVQGVELVAGAVNLALMSLNVRDGMRLTGHRARASG